jgi:hypothetical protein
MNLLPIDQHVRSSFLIILALSFVVEYYSRSCGLILTSDSYQYLAAAKSFREQGKLLAVDGTQYSFWPPLFPIILSVFKEPLAFLPWLNIVIKFCFAVILVKVAERFIQNRWMQSAFIFVSLLSVQIVLISVFVWSELLFLLLLFLNLWACVNERILNRFIVLVVTGFLLCLQRNAGLFCVVGVSIWLFVYEQKSFKYRLRTSILFFILASSSFVIWNTYQSYLIPNPSFEIHKLNFFRDFFINIRTTSLVLSRIVLPFQNVISALVFIIILASGAAYLILRFRSDPKVMLLLIILSTYVTGFLMMGPLDVYEIDRYFSVVVPIGYLLTFMVLEHALNGQTAVGKWMILAFLTYIVCYTSIRTLKNMRDWHLRSCAAQSLK